MRAESEHVDEAVQHDAVVLEREGLLLPRTLERRDPGGELRATVRREEALDPLELLGRRTGLKRSEVGGNSRGGEIDPLEQLVYR